MTPLEWAGILTAFGGTGLLGHVSGRKLSRANASKASAEAVNAAADAADKLTSIAVRLVEPVSEKLEKVERKLDAHVNRARAHTVWDIETAQTLRDNGLPVSNPPPLFDPR